MTFFLSPPVRGSLGRARSIRVHPDRVGWRKWYGPGLTVQRCKVMAGGDRLLRPKSPNSAEHLADLLGAPAVGMSDPTRRDDQP